MYATKSTALVIAKARVEGVMKATTSPLEALMMETTSIAVILFIGLRPTGDER